MPRYFFDVDDGERRTRDETGLDLTSVNEVERETRILLQNLSVPEVLSRKDRVFTAAVRDDRGVTVYRGSAVLRIDDRKD